MENYRWVKKENRFASWCKKCNAKASRLWAEKNKDKRKGYSRTSYYKNREKHIEASRNWTLKNKDYIRERRLGIKKRVMDGYGGMCACCGESNIHFLTIDHINNDGGERRKNKLDRGGNVLYSKILEKNFPDIFQVLCFNCNLAKSHHGGTCPHKL